MTVPVNGGPLGPVPALGDAVGGALTAALGTGPAVGAAVGVAARPEQAVFRIIRDPVSTTITRW
ncbi:hypothetical protein Voc01_038990 [Virgisporangium ochraceum]|uniref:Uncharacterized protein n=1 Tax=Virgisporangium ochraceum TaxID=65505 RepID=A0A8J4EEF9_9ACTN|nr:hypothetical protein Voc01_038990 [Virgisporangium ochraceum]